VPLTVGTLKAAESKSEKAEKGDKEKAEMKTSAWRNTTK